MPSNFPMIIQLKNWLTKVFTRRKPVKVPYAIALVRYPHTDYYLAVSRKNNLTDFGLPGGSVEEGESASAAARREVFEETSAVVDHPVELFTAQGEDGKLCSTFLFELVTWPICGSQLTGKVNSEGAVVKWLHKEDLCSGTFKEYNTKLFECPSLR